MSLLTDFISTAAPQALATIGTEPLSIAGGDAVQAVLAEETASRDFTDVGFSPAASLTAVALVADWSVIYPGSAIFYVGKSAGARGKTFRVGSVDIGREFVKISLTEKEKA